MKHDFVDTEVLKQRNACWDDLYKKIFDEIIESCPKADVVAVKRGRWEYDYYVVCSLCGSRGFPDYNYRPHCGAKMQRQIPRI